MAITFSSAPGALFNRIGKLGLLAKTVKSLQTQLYSNLTDTVNGVVAQYNAESDLQALIGSSYISTLGGVEGACTTAQNVAQQTFNRVVFRDNPQISQSLQSLNLNTSISEIIRQMNIEGATILAMTVSSSPVLFSNFNTNIGNGVVTASTKRPFDGRTLENSFAETVLFTCTNDSYSGGATAGNEPFAVTGTGNQPDPFAFNWPLGSNATASLSAIDGDRSNGSGNGLSNSNFLTFVSNVPSKFVLNAGTAGTNTQANGSIVFGSGQSLQLIGDGTTNVQLNQTFGSSSGTTNTLAPLTQYSVNLWVRRDGVAPAAGVLTVALVNNNAFTVINDQAGNPNSFTVSLTGLTTNFAAYNGVFRTPASLPTSYSLQLKETTALTTGRSVYLGKLSMGRMTQLYTSGPFFAVHAGSIPFSASGQQPDYTQVTITNSRGAAGTLSTFQTLLFQLLYPNVLTNEFIFPSSASPSISDSALIA